MIAEHPLLTAKLYIPPPRVGQVARPRLTQRLDEVLRVGCRLAVVSAPAGYGKSTLLAEWVRLLPGPAGWLSVDEDDNDPARFVAHLIAALGGVWPGAGVAALARLRAPQATHDLKPVLSSLVNDLLAVDPASRAGGNGGRRTLAANAAAGPPAVLVLDDYHLISAEAVHEAVGFLLDHLPGDLRVVVAGRSEPPLPMALLRARGQLVEVGLGDLSFTEAEAAQFFDEAMGLGLAAEQVRALEGRTEGWAAGLQLAALALQARPGGAGQDVAALVGAITGSHRFIGDYLVAEVLERQPAEVRRFLLHTSVLGRMEAGLCAAVAGEEVAHAAALLGDLDRARLFLIPLDDERRWYRYHHLFGEALRAKLRQTQPALEPELHRRAAAWYGGQDLLDEAIHHGLAARDFAQAARWIDSASDRMIRLGQLATIRSWIEALPSEVVRGDPALCVWYCWTLLDADRLAELEPIVQAAEAAFDTGGAAERYDAERRSQLAGQLAVIRSQRAYRLGQPDEGMAQARLALRTLSPLQVSLRSFVSLTLGQQHLRLGEAAAADAPLTEAHRAMGTVHHPFIRLQIAGAVAELRWLQGRLRAAAEVCREAIALADQHGLESLTAGLQERLGLVCLEQNELDAAEQQAEALARLTRRSGDVVGEAQAGLLKARILLARGKGAAAEQAVAEAGRQLAPFQEHDVRWWLGAWLARFWLAAGQVDRARAGLGQASEGSGWREFEAQVLARLLLAEGRAPEALSLAKQVRAEAERPGRHGPALRARVVQALAHAALGQASQALRVLEGALAAAAPEGFVRMFLDEGAPMLALLGRLAANHPQRSYADRLLALAGEAPERAARPASQTAWAPLAEPLTGREREILKLLAAGLTNQEIATRLVVAVDTVRWYSKQIYRKLEVHNRTQAVLRAQALGLA